MFNNLMAAIEHNLIAANRGDEYIEPRLRIFFDLDGTLYDLYRIPNWLGRIESIHTDKAGVFNEQGFRILNNEGSHRLRRVLEYLKSSYNATLGIISLMPPQVKDYPSMSSKVITEKKSWIQQNHPILLSNDTQEDACHNHCWIIPYNQPKHEIPKHCYPDMATTSNPNIHVQYYNVLIDDNRENRLTWRAAGKNYFTGNGTKNFVAGLETIANLYDQCTFFINPD